MYRESESPGIYHRGLKSHLPITGRTVEMIVRYGALTAFQTTVRDMLLAGF